ncbi:MAG: 2-hydroxyacid dehydrogenase [Gammaproteobacteria bacterium]|nr:2-hydroxyacid dehydrogenase [Gammaproteobacteria bacterium]
MTQITSSIPVLIPNEFHSETIEKLDTLFQTHKLWTLSPADQTALVAELKPVCKAVATASWQTSDLIYELPKLEIISCFGVGVDGINFGITKPRNIQVTNTPNVLNDAVADIAMALVLISQRNLINADRFVRSGEWHNRPFPLSNGLAGKTLGILGLGSIGEDIARRALACGMNIAYHNRHKKDLPYRYCPGIGELARASDILVCMLPGGTETTNVINKEVLRELGPQGIFINVGRGSSVDERDLVDALQSNAIAGAGLDVYQKEPAVPKELLSMDNVILLPHVGSATVETRRAMGDLVVDNLLAWSRSEPLITSVD